jgi:hypothetical protein
LDSDDLVLNSIQKKYFLLIGILAVIIIVKEEETPVQAVFDFYFDKDIYHVFPLPECEIFCLLS